ncbi:MAG TPA: polyhydroxyalkanoate depolymerase [Polyangiaceae bacterium]|nr:polyhydroxyalkanoate depolymerase [Polyangiaceae bacterium]
MLYRLHELQRACLDPVARVSGATARLLTHEKSPLAHVPGARVVGAGHALLHRLTRRYEKPAFGLARATAAGGEVRITEEVVHAEPFCRLVRFVREPLDASHAAHAAHAARLRAQPKVLLCAPLSGHHATLLRDTVRSLLADHDVYVTDWVCAREVPVAQGAFGLDDYVHTVQRLVRLLGAPALHVVAVCQPTVPVLAAIALLAQAGEPTPRTLTLMGGPVDARRSPTEVNRLATERSLAWFERTLIKTVPGRYPGRGRRVYPGFLQLSAFVAMNPSRHIDAHVEYWLGHLTGSDGEAKRASHERFYDDYNAVLDMDAPYYLETVRLVFQEFALARGTWEVGGERVRPAAIRDTALLTIEGADDDIAGLGQTQAAHALCTGVPAEHRRHHVAAGCGHYGVFSGRRWRESIYPIVRDFVGARSGPEAREARA